MKKEFSFTLLLILLSFLTNLYLPWWFTAIVACFCSFLFDFSSIKSFLLAFATMSTFWTLLSFLNYNIYSKNIVNHISEIFMNLNIPTLISIAAFLGGMTSGLGAWTGNALRKQYYKND